MSTNKDRLRALLLLHRTSPIDELVEKIDTMYSQVPEVPVEVRIDAFRRQCYAWNYNNKSKYESPVIEAFIALWTRLEADGKMKFESQPSFKIGGRLATFTKLNTKFTQQSQIERFKKAMTYNDPFRR